ncbi:hypothetical protein EMPS_09609 [Entomortierella parvispora]|uniref:MYND-type domain-containing protein n=1 Tax=Entomortierella parvispora TaxID=205924 RepID=A0A9P3HID6_9FUNG|nr:hypothetical protein EMPS_09609 [Entomortierella parvispora]
MADAPKCAKCSKTTGEGGIALKRCAKCKSVLYCSRACQTADWKVHKKKCGLAAGTVEPVVLTTPEGTHNFNSGTPVVPKGLDSTLPKPFTHLHHKTWLHNRSEKDVFRLLIDSFRLMLDDDYKFENHTPENSLYSGSSPDSRIPFRSFLQQAQRKSGLLPPWWTAADGTTKLDECVAFGLTDEFSNLKCAVDKGGIIDYYGQSNMPMQLRILREQITGRGPMGQSGAAMITMHMAMESGQGPQYMSTLDLSNNV